MIFNECAWGSNLWEALMLGLREEAFWILKELLKAHYSWWQLSARSTSFCVRRYLLGGVQREDRGDSSHGFVHSPPVPVCDSTPSIPHCRGHHSVVKCLEWGPADPCWPQRAWISGWSWLCPFFLFAVMFADQSTVLFMWTYRNLNDSTIPSVFSPLIFTSRSSLSC